MSRERRPAPHTAAGDDEERTNIKTFTAAEVLVNKKLVEIKANSLFFSLSVSSDWRAVFTLELKYFLHFKISLFFPGFLECV